MWGGARGGEVEGGCLATSHALDPSWEPFRTRLYIEREALRALGIEDCDEIIQEQFEKDSAQRAAGIDMTLWDESHANQLKETLQALHAMRQPVHETGVW